MMNSKKGMAGTIVASLVISAMILIFIISFAVFSSTLKKIDGARGKINVDNETDVGINDIYFYMDFFKSQIEEKKIFFGGNLDEK